MCPVFFFKFVPLTPNQGLFPICTTNMWAEVDVLVSSGRVWHPLDSQKLFVQSNDMCITRNVYHMYFTTESCRIYKWVMICISPGSQYVYVAYCVYHIIYISYVFYHWVMTNMWMSHNICITSESVCVLCVYHITYISHVCYHWVMTHIWMSHNMYITSESVCVLFISHNIYITCMFPLSHVTYMNES